MGQLLASSTALELAEEMAFRQVVPWPDDVQQEQMAALLCMFVNAHRGENSKAAKVEDFLPKMPGQKEKRQTIEEQKAIAKKATMIQQFWGK